MENLGTKKEVESTTTENNFVEVAKAEKTPNQNIVDANSTNDHLISVSTLIKVGAHIGLPPSKWNPKMAPYIYVKKSNNHVIDIIKSLSFIKRAAMFLQNVTQNDGKVLIIGTRGQLLKDLIVVEAARGNTYFVNQRWLGGTLTNFKVIKKSIKKMNDNLQSIADGSINSYTKKEQLYIQKETDKLVKFYGGIRNMRKLPAAIIVLNPIIDKIAILEARKLGIPVIALANTNSNPDLIDYIIPINNNSIKSIGLILNILVDAICLINDEPTKVIGIPEDQIVLIEQPPKIKKFYPYKKKYNYRR